MKNKQNGFTLIELMVALVLGLIIVAAGIQLLITGQRSLNMQQGAADIQSNAVFGLNYMLRDIELANLDATSTVITDSTGYGGVVLSAANVNGIAKTPLSQSELNSSNVTVGGAEQKSDQLVVQFYTIQSGFDCEGNRYDSSPGQYIIQRYFLRPDTHGSSTEPNSALGLACEAGRYVAGSTTIAKGSGTAGNFGSGSGQIILHRVDQFHVLLGVSNAAHDGGFRYMTIKQYMALPSRADTRINSLQLGLLVRSAASVGSQDAIRDTATFNVLDQLVTVKSNKNTAKYLRKVAQQTIALRNGLCISDSTFKTQTCS